jgi:hypothetical protein
VLALFVIIELLCLFYNWCIKYSIKVEPTPFMFSWNFNI